MKGLLVCNTPDPCFKGWNTNGMTNKGREHIRKIKLQMRMKVI
jgi:hypothetical protein